jgi:hypothetical protein
MIHRLRRAPSVQQLWVAPELASLAVLDAAIDVAILAIGAVYPEMQDQDPADQTASLRAATVVLEDARTLAASLARYRVILRRAPDRAEDHPV